MADYILLMHEDAPGGLAHHRISRILVNLEGFEGVGDEGEFHGKYCAGVEDSIRNA